MKLVWHVTNLLEVDWLRDIFGDLIDGEITDLNLTCFEDETIHVISGNQAPLPSYDPYFRTCRAQCKRLILVHIGDEWFSGGYRLYQHFDAVIRTYHTYLADHQGILTLPLGYTNGTSYDGRQRADARHYVWSFAGEIKASRIAMVAALEGIEPAFVARTDSISNPNGNRLSKAEYNDLLATTVFAPCPMGNVILDTWRLYESLELGCIPLVECRVSIDYFANLFGPNPIPSFCTWRDARHYIQTSFADKRGLLRLQDTIGDWWTAHKTKLHDKVRALITGPSQAALLQQYSAFARNRIPLLHEPLRMIELLRHQNGDSLRRRMMRPSGPLKRVITNLTHK